jgi:hypothetical protein
MWRPFTLTLPALSDGELLKFRAENAEERIELKEAGTGIRNVRPANGFVSYCNPWHAASTLG